MARLERIEVHPPRRRLAGAEPQAELLHLRVDHPGLGEHQVAAGGAVQRRLPLGPHRRELRLDAVRKAEHEGGVQRPPPSAAATQVLRTGTEAVGLRLEGVGDQVHEVDRRLHVRRQAEEHLGEPALRIGLEPEAAVEERGHRWGALVERANAAPPGPQVATLAGLRLELELRHRQAVPVQQLRHLQGRRHRLLLGAAAVRRLGTQRLDAGQQRGCAVSHLWRSFSGHSGGYSGNGMNSASPATRSKRPARQSDLACSIRSRRLETKFHQTCRGPSIGSPPSTSKRVAVTA